jgi:hypothetical protein
MKQHTITEAPWTVHKPQGRNNRHIMSGSTRIATVAATRNDHANECKHNAQLLAEAPALLAMLERCITALKAVGLDVVAADAETIARVARGESTLVGDTTWHIANRKLEQFGATGNPNDPWDLLALPEL